MPNAIFDSAPTAPPAEDTAPPASSPNPRPAESTGKIWTFRLIRLGVFFLIGWLFWIIAHDWRSLEAAALFWFLPSFVTAGFGDEMPAWKLGISCVFWFALFEFGWTHWKKKIPVGNWLWKSGRFGAFAFVGFALLALALCEAKGYGVGGLENGVKPLEMLFLLPSFPLLVAFSALAGPGQGDADDLPMFLVLTVFSTFFWFIALEFLLAHRTRVCRRERENTESL
jgi:hypothetical protein